MRNEYRYVTTTEIPAPLDEVFEFFSDAFNLERITPPWLNFRVLTPKPIHIRRGTRLEYKLRLNNVPLRWLTEITLWEPPFRFVDCQLRGPYQKWVHLHEFRGTGPNTTHMTDHVVYALPFGLLGKVSHGLFVKRRVNAIFTYRKEEIRKIFLKPTPNSKEA